MHPQQFRAIAVALGVLTLLALPAIGRAQQVPLELIRYPETILYNGDVLTVDTDQGDFTVVQAIAVRDGKILALGSTATVLKLAGPQTRKIDLSGKAVMPGIIDTHVHTNRYALDNYFKELPGEYQRLLRADGRITEWNDKAQVLEEVRRIVERHDPSKEWVMIGSARERKTPPELHDKVAKSITREDLDQISNDKPIFLSDILPTSSWNGVVNSKALERIFAIYPEESVPGVLKDAKGVPTGQLRLDPTYILRFDIMPQVPAQALAPIFEKELREKWAPRGFTTITTRLPAPRIRAHAFLEVQGKLPLRLAYGHEVGQWNPIFERDMNRMMSVVDGYGSDKMWMVGINVAPPDPSPEEDLCTSYARRDGPVLDEVVSRWEAPGDTTKDVVRSLFRHGYRVATMHSYGDKGSQIAVDLFKEIGVEPKHRFALDHSGLFTPELIRKSSEIGVRWSAGSQKFLNDPAVVSTQYGREVADNMLSPLRALIGAGLKVTYESSARGADTTPFHDMQMWVTRVSGDGNVWGARNALDRQTVLRMMTRWGSEYVLKEDKIGSLEPGKYADLIVLSRNPLDPALPAEQLSTIRNLMTMVGGELVFVAPDAGL